MFTPEQIVANLADLGIHRNSRVLTDWRQKGLLPALHRVGQGRGQGTVSGWQTDVTEQAVACHLLLQTYSRAKNALLDLWMAGYDIDPGRAQSVWLNSLEQRRDRWKAESARRENSNSAIGDRWVSSIQKSGNQPEQVAEFIRDLPAWLIDGEFDRESFQAAVAEIIAAMAIPSKAYAIPSPDSYENIQRAWKILDLEAFKLDNAIALVKGASSSRLRECNHLFDLIRRSIQRWVEVASSADVNMRIHMSILLLRGFAGVLAILLLSIKSNELLYYVNSTLYTLHSFVETVELEENQQQCGIKSLTPKSRRRWHETVKEIDSLFGQPPISPT